MVPRITLSRKVVRVGTSVSVAMCLAACGSTEASPDDGAVVSSEIVAEAEANVEQYFGNNGAQFSLDPVLEPDALEGKTLMYLSAGLSSPSGTAGLAALEDIQSGLGFDLVSFDGEFTPSKHQEGMRQAVAQGVDALLIYGVDCAGNEAALREVDDAGIPVIGLQSVDCDEADPSAEGMFDAQPLHPIGGASGTDLEWWAANGAAQADYLIANLEGDVRVIQFDVPDFAVTASLGEGFRDRMAQCTSCEILETVQVGVADLGPGLQQKAEQAILEHPDANAVEISYDDLVTLGLSAAIVASGRQADLLTIAGTGNEAIAELIRQDAGLDAGWLQNPEWDHYAGVDTVLRVLSDQEPAVNSLPVSLYDEDHNVPASGGPETKTDFRGVFEEAWGRT